MAQDTVFDAWLRQCREREDERLRALGWQTETGGITWHHPETGRVLSREDALALVDRRPREASQGRRGGRRGPR